MTIQRLDPSLPSSLFRDQPHCRYCGIRLSRRKLEPWEAAWNCWTVPECIEQGTEYLEEIGELYRENEANNARMKRARTGEDQCLESAHATS